MGKIKQMHAPILSLVYCRNMNKRILLSVATGFLIGALWLTTARFVLFKDDNVHYHANFALYVNGKRDMFDNFTFYEEVQSCGSDQVNDPKIRVHLHDNNPSVIHVHDAGVTWGHLFANLGYTLGNGILKTDDGTFVDGTGGSLHFVLNGKLVDGVANTTIRSEDTLLIDYGNDDQTVLQSRYDQIPKDAKEFNAHNDPSTCSGSEPATFTTRLKHAVSLSQ